MTGEMRGGGRSNVFLSATLNCGSHRAAVRIRNMSRSGALIDGAELPLPGTRVRLSRGSVSALGSVAWQEKRHAGVKFESEVDVRRWTERMGHAGQERVDTIVAAIRSGAAPIAHENPDDLNGDSLPILSEALDQVCRRLASMPLVTLEVGEEMIKLDLIAQSLRRHASTMR